MSKEESGLQREAEFAIEFLRGKAVFVVWRRRLGEVGNTPLGCDVKKKLYGRNA
jgi:hypothetical protein